MAALSGLLVTSLGVLPASSAPTASPFAGDDAATENAEPASAEEAKITAQKKQSFPDIVFPVVGPVFYSDTWGACRGSGCTRSHEGVDLFGHKLAPIVAAEDGVIGFVRTSSLTISGNAVVLEADSGWTYYYVHLNNDRPGTDDGANPQAWITPNRLRAGSRVTAGQVIGYLGDSGNAEDTDSHLHFEAHSPADGAVNPTPLVTAAEEAGRRVSVASLASTAEGRAASADLVNDWYQRILGREPTEMELFAWTDRFDIGFADENDLVADLAMDKSLRDGAGAVLRTFQAGLNRRPSLNEISQWSAALDGAFSPTDMAKVLIESPTFVSQYGELDDPGFVEVVYLNATGDLPSHEQLDRWTAELGAGMSRAELVAHWADSYEMKDSLWHDLEVVQLYRAKEGRMPSDEELDRWVAHLDAGGLIVDIAAQSTEPTPVTEPPPGTGATQTASTG